MSVTAPGFTRSSGVLLHVTSLPGPYGIGDLGPAAHSWIDWLADAGCRYWQILPLGPTGFGDSPYSSFSSAAGNPNLISPESLVAEGLVDSDEVVEVGEASRVDYDAVHASKSKLLQIAFGRLDGGLRNEFEEFSEKEEAWLGPYALFMALKARAGGEAWSSWPIEIRKREPDAIADARERLGEEVDRHAFGQFIFYRQLESLRRHASERDVEIIGDVPLYVAPDSVDVWVEPGLFTMDLETGKPTYVSGVPPDMFSDTGQWWGTPLYAWDAHAADGYAWWANRLRHFFRQADVLRLDHFTGLARYYEIDGRAENALHGVWREGPGLDFFEAMERALGPRRFIVEDLGPLGRPVESLRIELGYPGMMIAQEAFERVRWSKLYPSRYPRNCVAYTGTHDNDTAKGRFEDESPTYRRRALAYSGDDERSYPSGLIERLWESAAVITVAPLQDLLRLGSAARMNVPATTEGNWQWRAETGAASSELADRLAVLNERTGRRA